MKMYEHITRYAKQWIYETNETKKPNLGLYNLWKWTNNETRWMKTSQLLGDVGNDKKLM